MSREPEVRVRRVYQEPSADDGLRILVDRLWPRGLSKAAAHLDEWVKDVAPSTELRRWYSHDPARFAEFKRRYVDELGDAEHAPGWQRLVRASAEGTVTLLTATRNTELSEAAVLAEQLAKTSRKLAKR